MSATLVAPTGSLLLRLRLLRRAVVVTFTSVPAAGLFAIWLTVVAISPLTVVALLVLPATAAVRWYANLHRSDAVRLTGAPVRDPYRPTTGLSPLRRVWAVVADPQSWRDAAWLLVHAVAGFALALVQVVLVLAGLFYLIYPFLYWVTPQDAFRRPFGAFEIHSVAASTMFMPLAVVAFLLWYGLAVPLTRADVALNRAMLGT